MYVELRRHEFGGPFWSDEGGLSDEYDAWEPLGMTRATYDACVQWNQVWGTDQRKAQLLDKLREELPEYVQVESFNA